MNENIRKAVVQILNENYISSVTPLRMKLMKQDESFLQIQILERILINIEKTTQWVVYTQGHISPQKFENIINSGIDHNSDLLRSIIRNI